jgi:hypothetical protein
MGESRIAPLAGELREPGKATSPIERFMDTNLRNLKVQEMAGLREFTTALPKDYLEFKVVRTGGELHNLPTSSV